AVVPELGIWRSTVEKTGRLPEMVAARIRAEFQNANAGRPRSERLSARRFAGVRSIHDASNPEGAVEDVVLSRRRSLGAQATKFTLVVQNRERLGGSMVQAVNARCSGVCVKRRIGDKRLEQVPQ